MARSLQNTPLPAQETILSHCHFMARLLKDFLKSSTSNQVSHAYLLISPFIPPFILSYTSTGANGAKSEVSGTGIQKGVADRPVRVSVQAKDIDGAPRTDGGDVFRVVFEHDGGNSFDASVVDNGMLLLPQNNRKRWKRKGEKKRDCTPSYSFARGWYIRCGSRSHARWGLQSTCFAGQWCPCS